MNDLGSFSVAQKNSPKDRLSVSPPTVHGKLAVLVHLPDTFRRRALIRTVDDSGID